MPVTEPSSPVHLLGYYRECVSAEGRYDLVFTRGSPAIALLTEGREPVVSRPPGDRAGNAAGIRDAAVASWCHRQLSSARPEPVSVGYPIVCGRPGPRSAGGWVAALLTRECRIEVGRGGEVHLVGVEAPAELNAAALQLLGWGAEERARCQEAFTGSSGRLPRRFAHAVEQLRASGVDLRGIDPDHLEPLPHGGGGLANTAMLVVAGPPEASRGVLADLDRLIAGPAGQLGRGPLAVVLGAAAPGGSATSGGSTAPAARPVPLIAASNLSQDRAVTAALSSPLTVVTGPPGTGKSQVLVNAVAAAVIGGQSVLFASRTNRAVDVVFERLEEIGVGAPLRAGRSALRVQAARRIEDALVSGTGIRMVGEGRGGPGSNTARLARRLDPLYAQLAARQRLEVAIAADLRAADGRAARWGWNFASGPGRAGSSRSGPDRDRRADERAAQRWRQRAAGATRELSRLAPEADLRARLAGFGDARLAVGRRQWAAAWAHRTGAAPPRARAASAAVAALLASGQPVGRSGAAFRAALSAFPVWGLTNLAAASCLPLELALFDLVVIDEASQCDVASALPLLARARRALIIGDRHQLTHVSRLSRERELAIAARHGVGTEVLDELSQRRRSLYDVACGRVGEAPLLLDEHYRCHPELIGFTNARLYGGRLTIRTVAAPGGGFSWTDVQGCFRPGPSGRGACNPVEAAAAAARLAFELEADPTARIGIVTPFRAQVELIRRLVGTAIPAGGRAGGPAGGRAGGPAGGRAGGPAGGPAGVVVPDNVTIDTVYRFQGDERDVIILSPMVSADLPPFLLRVAGEPRLLNVAITRARHRVAIVGDRQACRDAGGMLAELSEVGAP